MSRQSRFVMPIALAMHRVQHTNIVDDRPKMWKQLANPCSALTVLLKRKSWLDQKPIVLAGLIQPPGSCNRFAVIGYQLRPMIKGVDMRRTTRRVQKDHSIGLCGVMSFS
jgi:hypothetical protein